MKRPESSVHPPRWAEAVLRMFLKPDEAEAESGDLLEAYRDSIHPSRGRWRANLWFIRQVAGYLLWAGPTLSNWLLAGLTLCALTIVFIPHRLGAQGGIMLALAAFALPFVAGAHGAIKAGKVRAGMRVGFWSGLISGLIAFFALALIGYLCAFVPGLPGAEIPSKDRIYTAAEFQRLNVWDALGGGLAHLFLIGGLFGVIGGTFGGWAGIRLERTGRGPDVPALDSVDQPTEN